MKDLGLLHYYLVIEVDQKPKYIFISQKSYIGQLLDKFWMWDCNLVATPIEKILKLTSTEGSMFEDPTMYMQLIGSLDLLTTTQPNIIFVVGILSKFMHQPCEAHWNIVKQVLKYLKGTQTYGIRYSEVRDIHLTSYSYLNFDGDKENQVSTSSYLMNLGSTAISWRSCKKFILVDSTTKSDYVATAQDTKEIICLDKRLEYLQEKQKSSTPLFVDNSSIIQLKKNIKFHD